ncbi:hypothetical protein KAM546c_44850 (plasmid) [Enterobacter roggenkampii]|nr:hypothetical protein KAM546c_44850 [Enterobacter roggenkampii]
MTYLFILSITHTVKAFNRRCIEEGGSHEKRGVESSVENDYFISPLGQIGKVTLCQEKSKLPPDA